MSVKIRPARLKLVSVLSSASEPKACSEAMLCVAESCNFETWSHSSQYSLDVCLRVALKCVV